MRSTYEYKTIRMYTPEGFLFEMDIYEIREYLLDTYNFKHQSNDVMFEKIKQLSIHEIVDKMRFVGVIDDRKLAPLSKCFFDMKENPQGTPKKANIKGKTNML